MKPIDRFAWIEKYLTEHDCCDALDRTFVDAYDLACQPATVVIMPFGANKIPQLGRDLGQMYLQGRLTRHATGLPQMRGMGFPAWTYVYRLKAKPNKHHPFPTKEF
ncbi:hypothetical protein D3C87_687440 [compost metagenome]